MAQDVVWNSKTVAFDFAPLDGEQCARRTIWLKPGAYETQMFVDRWKSHMRSDWRDGAKWSKKKWFRLSHGRNYTWESCAHYGSRHGGVVRGRRFRFWIDVQTTVNSQGPPFEGWGAQPSQIPLWGTDSGDGTYHFGSTLRWTGP